MKKQSGFSIVELMVAVVLGLVISAAISVIFLTSNKTNKTQDNTARLQENARLAINKMQTDIRLAGYRGCNGKKVPPLPPLPPLDSNIIAAITYVNNMGLSLQGFNGGASSWSPALDGSISGASPAPALGSDVITIRMGVGAGVPLSAALANGLATIPITSNTDNLLIGSAALIADCEQSIAFIVTATTATTLSHTAGSNTVADFGRAFGTDALVMPVSTVTYYVAPSSDLVGGLSLWRTTNGGASEELADNVEKLKILYGEDIDGDLAPDKYVTANNVLNMNNVIAIKLMLLMRTSDDNLSALGQSYTFNGVAGIVPTDKRIRRTFTTTVTIRNRAT